MGDGFGVHGGWVVEDGSLGGVDPGGSGVVWDEFGGRGDEIVDIKVLALFHAWKFLFINIKLFSIIK